LEITSASFGALETVRSAASFLIRGHAIKHAVLLAHQGCGYYKDKFRLDSPEFMQHRQATDLRAAARWVASHHAGVKVSAFYARVDGEQIRFEPIDGI
jgi:hypothetical protein